MGDNDAPGATATGTSSIEQQSVTITEIISQEGKPEILQILAFMK